MVVGARTAAWSGEKLPYDAEVEYLAKTESEAFIDTGILIDRGLDFEIDAQITATKTSIGGNVDYGSDYYRFTFGYRANVVTGTFYSFFGDAENYFGYRSDSFALQRHLFEHKNSSFYIDSTHIKNDLSHYVENVNNITYYLFACHSGSEGMSLNGGAKIYSAKFSRNGVAVADFIPVRVGSVGYMYDRVSKTLFGNAGSGAFIVGPDKT